MKKRSREINIFSMSALDLFACSMGAFILITLILFPYYLKKESEHPKCPPCEKCKVCPPITSKVLKFAILGILTEAKSFVLVIDFSGSIENHTKQLKYVAGLVLEPMTSEYQFGMITYQGASNNPDIKSVPPTKPYAPHVASPKNKRLALDELDTRLRSVDGGTPTEAALEEALKYSVEAIILLSDGAPNGVPGDIVDEITRLNNGQKKIYSIAIGDYSAKKTFIEFLTSLAYRNDGASLGAPLPRS